ncbi:MAG: MazG-like family protein [Candidatus Gracilibacteria bacterium]|nr:MazG-like family protein [Candidatus Gracilibacteria bacterium]MDD2908930.1 MazG-like family protein [Candidatus Gracilibacteria bacterium]
MEFGYIKQKVMETWKSYFLKFDIENDDYYPMVKLSEEVGELSEAFLNYKGKSRPAKSKLKSKDLLKEELADELSDVIGTVILMADELGIDLEKTIERKWFDKNK